MKKEYEKPYLQAEDLVADTHLALNIVYSDGQDIYDDFPEDDEE